jgi:hypothetical protein
MDCYTFFRPRAWSSRGKVAVPVGGGDSAIHEEVAACNERAVRPHQQSTDVSYLVRVSARPAGHISIMRRYPAPRGPESSSLASGVMMIPGLIVLIRAPRLTAVVSATVAP